jgi:hypothetical protein
VACPGSRALEALYPEDEESPHAREGEAAHWVASELLQYYCLNNGADETNATWETAPNGELITDEMREGADIYCDSILTVINRLFGTMDIKNLHIEEPIDISIIHPECWGTPDCWVHHLSELHIWDYKFGHGFVEVFENWQLVEYAAGILEKLKIDSFSDQFLSVTFYIVQPRSYHRDGTVRTWKVMASDLRSLHNILRHAEFEATAPGAHCSPSPECTYCTGRHACETLQRSALSSVDLSISNNPLELTSEGIGNELRYLRRAADLLDARITGLSEQALSLIKKGKRIPHFHVEESGGREKWRVPADEIAVLGEMLGHNLVKPRDVITPRQAIKAGIPEEVVKSYTEISHGALKLVPENPNTVRKIFGGNK